MGAAPPVSTHNFEAEVLNSEVPVLVDFWNAACAPCRLIAPVVDKLALEYAGKAKIVKLDTIENPEIAADYRVSAVPTLLYFQSGQVVNMLVGARPEQHIKSALDALL